MCDKSNDCAAHIHTVQYLLRPADLDMTQKTANQTTAADDDDDEEEPTGEFVIKSKPLDFQETLDDEREHKVKINVLLVFLCFGLKVQKRTGRGVKAANALLCSHRIQMYL